jgi:hypothetical protein
MLSALLLLLGVQRGFSADGWPWTRIPLSSFPGTDAESAPGPLTDGAIAFLASHYDIVNLEGTITDSTNASCGENRIAEAAARLLARNASVRPFFYLNNIINYLDTCAAEDFAAHHSDLYLRTPNGSIVTINGHPARDISNPAVNAWYASTISNATVLKYIRGAFCDKAQVDASFWVSALGEAKAAAIVAGQQRQLDAVRSALGPGRTVVFNGMRASEGNLSLALLGPHADGGEMEHWLSLEQRTSEGALDLTLVGAALELLSGAAALLPPRTVIMRSMPGPCISSKRASGALGCNWPNNTRPTAPAALAAAATAHLPFSLAAFLIVAGPRFHMDWGWGYRVNDYVPCPSLAPAVAPCYVPDAWFPLLLKAPGTPLAGMQQHGAWSFTRNFTGVNVSIDFAAETASLAWDDASLDTYP